MPKTLEILKVKKVFILLSLLLAGCNTDLYTKKLAEEKLKPMGNYTLVENTVELRYAENTAIAFSLLHNVDANIRKILIPLLGGIALIILSVFAYGMRNKGYGVLIPLALIFGGAIGNLYERLSKGYVVDFMHVHYKDMWSFPIFNVADSLIVIGMTLLLIFGNKPTHPPNRFIL